MVLGKGIFGADIDLGIEMEINQFLSFNKILLPSKNSQKKKKGTHKTGVATDNQPESFQISGTKVAAEEIKRQ